MPWIYCEETSAVIINPFSNDMTAEVFSSFPELNNNDWLSIFLDECCEVNPDYKEKSGSVYQEYRDYCARNGEWARSTADFYTAMETMGFDRIRKKTVCM